MRKLPNIEASRLRLRGFVAEDAARVQALAGHPDVAATTQNIPHPYEEGLAEAWIEQHPELWQRGEALCLAVTMPTEGLVGAVSIFLSLRHVRGELGYWIGRPYWNQGLATEAAKALMNYSFETMDLNRIEGRHFKGNDASGAVLRKLGMRHEGTLREHALKDGRYLDMEVYGLLRREWKLRFEAAG